MLGSLIKCLYLLSIF